MPRVHDREVIMWDQASIDHLVELGQATYFPGLPGYVVKRPEGGQVAVRMHQILSSAPVVVEERVASPMDGYAAKENYDGEDTGPGGVVYDNAVRLATEYLAAIEDTATDVLTIVRHILDDEDGEYANSLNETIYDIRHAAQRAAVAPKAARAAERADILAHFTKGN